MPKIPTSLGTPAIPQAGNARRVASIDSSGQADALISGSRLLGTAFHRTAAGVQDIGQAFDKLQLQQDQKEAKDWLNQLMQAKTDMLYGEGGYMTLQGDAAVKGAATASQKLDKLREQMLTQTSNKQVSNLFDAASSQLIAPDKEEILRHAARENLVALDNTDESTVSAATDQLASNPTSDQVEKNSIALIAGSVSSWLDRHGVTDPVARNQKILETVSAARASAIQTALVRDPKSGAALYAKWKDQIQGTDQAKLEQSIVQAEDRQMRNEEHKLYMQEHAVNVFKAQEEDRLANLFIKGQLTVDDIYNSGADGSAKVTFANALRTQDKEGQQIVGNADLFIDTFKRLSLPPDDPRYIKDRSQYVGLIGRDGLNTEQINSLDTEFTKIHKDGDAQGQELKKQWLKTVTQELSGENELLGIKDPKGQRAVGNALLWGLQQYDKMHKAGVSDMEIYNPNSPRADSLYNGIQQFKRSPQEMFQDLFNANPGNSSLSIGAAQQANKYSKLEDLQADAKAGKITKDEAKKIAIEKGWAKP